MGLKEDRIAQPPHKMCGQGAVGYLNMSPNNASSTDVRC